MLLIKSKYKIGKRLGPAIFEKCQTQKFALSEARSRGRKDRRAKHGVSDYGRQLLEKQKVRFTYGISEKQLYNYAKKAFESSDPSAALHRALETRADNAAYRAGLAPTRRAARQMISHGHIKVNGRRITIPSFTVRKGDLMSVREGSMRKGIFSKLSEKEEPGPIKCPWISLDAGVMAAKVSGEPSYSPVESGVDYSTVFEFYSR